MADIVSVKKQSDNVREAVFQFNYQYVDGGNESAVQKIDASTLDVNSNGDACTGLKILDCNFNVAGMTVQVLKDGDSQDPIMLNLTEDQSGNFDFKETGGLPSTTELTEATRTYAVTVVNSGGNKFALGGSTNPAINLLKNHTYIFDQSDNTNSGHPLRFSTTANGTHGGGAEYTTGVTVTGTPGSSGAKTTIVTTADTPDLFYYCTNHSGMGNSSSLVNPTGDVLFTTTGAAANDSYQIVMRLKKNYKVQ
jgi:hypothetical protein|tara:strand:- start:405 stop:1157 length:753 start_codon:yes stop_codon:yes gene_type:complete